MISTEKLKNKEVINIKDGKSIGFVCDIEVNLLEGTIDGIVIPGERRMFTLFNNRDNDILIKWNCVRTVGDDVILVEIENL